tara:strand:- start:1014 stop:1127 length:114 start_codon:yes stop_codon:yes gene_type:complete
MDGQVTTDAHVKKLQSGEDELRNRFNTLETKLHEVGS